MYCCMLMMYVGRYAIGISRCNYLVERKRKVTYADEKNLVPYPLLQEKIKHR